MNAIQGNYAEIIVEADGSAIFMKSENVYQYSNISTGVVVYTPYYPEGLSVLINIRLPDGTVLQENPMTPGIANTIDGEIYYDWHYDFPSAVTNISGYDYSVPITVSFRITERNGKTTKNTNQLKIMVQPSLQGTAMIVDPTTADVLNGKVDTLYYQVGLLKTGTRFVGTIDDVPEGEEQTYLTEFVKSETRRFPGSGDLVNIYGRDEQWIYGSFNFPMQEYSWKFFTSLALFPATSSVEGVSKLYSETGQNYDGSMSQLAVTMALNDQQEFRGISQTYYTIGKNITETITGSAPHVYIACEGTIKIDTASPNVYVWNSPYLTINGKTVHNWDNIYVDGTAESPNLATTWDYYLINYTGDALTIPFNKSKAQLFVRKTSTFVELYFYGELVWTSNSTKTQLMRMYIPGITALNRAGKYILGVCDLGIEGASFSGTTSISGPYLYPQADGALVAGKLNTNAGITLSNRG